MITTDQLRGCPEIKMLRDDDIVVVFEIPVVSFDDSGRSSITQLEISCEQVKGVLIMDENVQIQALNGVADIPISWRQPFLEQSLTGYIASQALLLGMPELEAVRMGIDLSDTEWHLYSAVQQFRLAVGKDFSEADLPEFMRLAAQSFLELLKTNEH